MHGAGEVWKASLHPKLTRHEQNVLAELMGSTPTGPLFRVIEI